MKYGSPFPEGSELWTINNGQVVQILALPHAHLDTWMKLLLILFCIIELCLSLMIVHTFFEWPLLCNFRALYFNVDLSFSSALPLFWGSASLIHDWPSLYSSRAAHCSRYCSHPNLDTLQCMVVHPFLPLCAHLHDWAASLLPVLPSFTSECPTLCLGAPLCLVYLMIGRPFSALVLKRCIGALKHRLLSALSG